MIKFLGIYICIVLQILSVNVLGATAASKLKKPANLSRIIMDMSSVYGEKNTRFVIKIENEKNMISVISNAGDAKEKVLSSKDVIFIKKEFEKLPIPQKIPNECARAKMIVTWFNSPKLSETKTSCLGIHTLSEPAYVRFAQILVNAL